MFVWRRTCLYLRPLDAGCVVCDGASAHLDRFELRRRRNKQPKKSQVTRSEWGGGEARGGSKWASHHDTSLLFSSAVDYVLGTRFQTYRFTDTQFINFQSWVCQDINISGEVVRLRLWSRIPLVFCSSQTFMDWKSPTHVIGHVVVDWAYLSG